MHADPSQGSIFLKTTSECHQTLLVIILDRKNTAKNEEICTVLKGVPDNGGSDPIGIPPFSIVLFSKARKKVKY